MKRLTALQKVKFDLCNRYRAQIAGKQSLIDRSMLIAYEKGVDDAFEWVKNYNEANKDKTPGSPVLEIEPTIEVGK